MADFRGRLSAEASTLSEENVMKKAFAMIAVMGLVAVPLMAAPLVQLSQDRTSFTEILGTPSNPQGTTGTRAQNAYDNDEVLYDNMWSAVNQGAGFLGTGSANLTLSVIAGSATFVMDDISLASSFSSASLGGLHWVFYNPGGSGGSGGTATGLSTTDTWAFFSNPGTGAIGATIGAFQLTGIPTGFFVFTLDFSGSGLVLPKNSWIGFRKSFGTVAYLGGTGGDAGASTQDIGLGFGSFPSPGITTALVSPVSAVGAGGTGGGSLHIAMGLFPEPASAALLALGGLVALRRRRLA